MIDTLKNLGLSDTEAAIYKALVDVGPCFVAPLVRETHKHRQIIYNALNSLERKQLISVTKKNGKNFYSVGDPKRFLIEAKQKELLAGRLVEQIEGALRKEKEHVVEVFRGPDSYRKGMASFRQHAEETEEYIVIRGESEGWFEYTRPFFKEHVDDLKRIKRKGIDCLLLFFERERQLVKQFLGSNIGDPYTCKIASNEYRLPHSTWLAGDHIYILTPTPDPLIIHIKSKPMAHNYRDYFWNLWKKGEILK